MSVSAQRRGAIFEEDLRTYLENRLAEGGQPRTWSVERGGNISNFVQFRHLAAVGELVAADKTGLLRNAIDYVIKPDVVVAFETPAGRWLHASVSCKFTIRSDRVQNARHEANIMLRHRRGRAPHIVTVTAEPLPSRIASIARGTGEIDATYHLSLESFETAVDAVGNTEQSSVLAELVGNARLFDLSTLPEHLAH